LSPAGNKGFATSGETASSLAAKEMVQVTSALLAIAAAAAGLAGVATETPAPTLEIDAPATTGETPTHVAQARGHAAAHAWLVARGGVATAPAKKKSSFSFSPKKLSPKKSPSK